MSKLDQLAELGQSIWLDFIRRSLITSGELQELVGGGLRGMTSNPTIFDKAISGSNDYDESLRDLVAQGGTIQEIYEALAIEDIRLAADVLRPVFDRSDGLDGYVSLEVSPKLAHDTAGTVDEARRLFAALERPNVMIKVPATPAGLPAIETLIAEGLNINVTLIFSLDQYRAVAEAYIAGLEKLAASGGDPARSASVASFFVSRIDSAVDQVLEVSGPEAVAAQGKTAVASAKVAYAIFEGIFAGERWERLAALGARVQRPLWASTSTKNPDYPDTLYVDTLIGRDTVNTLPPATLDAVRDHGTIALTVTDGVEEARQHLARLPELGVDLEAVTQKLLDDGVASFAKSFDSLLASVDQKCQRLRSDLRQHRASLGSYQAVVNAALEEMAAGRIISRIWDHDHTVWKPDPTEITNRLGWLHIPEKMQAQHQHLEEFVRSVRADGYTDILLLGMGGSSLAPEVFGNVFGRQAAGTPHLQVLDSTVPGAILAHAGRLDPARTLFIVATKSGGTAETLSFFKYFYNWTADALGADQTGNHFVAITDPGSKLVDLATRHDFRATFLNDPNIGGRYSALSYFGLVPAALVGVDVEQLLGRALALTADRPADGRDAGAWLGAILGELGKAGRDKVTIVTPPALANFPDWLEQLIAESTGKEGSGILPVVGEPLGPPQVYGEDRLFVYLQLEGDTSSEEVGGGLRALEDAGHPVVRLRLRDLYDLGEQFLLWEVATVVAGHRLGINPFNQPDVEAAKILARQAIDSYRREGALPDDEPVPLTAESLSRFLEQARTGDYVALQAYVQPTPDTNAALLALRGLVRDRLRLATTVGYGPRFLHSTGQLHKGDRGNGLFIQFTADDAQDLGIPDEAGDPDSAMSFGVLKMAQALGDKQALRDAGRRVIRFHLGSDVVGGLQMLAGGLV